MSATVVPIRDVRRIKRPPRPFSVEHFRIYASRLVFDDGQQREPEDFQLDFAREVFRGIGQSVRENWLLIPEGNGKTTLVAELALYGADWAPRPWIPVGASSRDQAKTLYTQAKGFVDDTPGMGHRFQCFDGYRSIIPIRNGKKRPGRGIEICPWDPATNDGVIPYPYFICDEMHRHPDMSLWRLWKGKARKRKAVGIGISTAGAPGEEFEDARDRVRETTDRVRRAHGGSLYRSPRFSMWEYRLEDPELATNAEAVAAVNPLSSVTVAEFEEELESPTLDLGEFKRLKANIPARSTFAAITDEEWAKARALGLLEIPEGVRVDCGLDLGWKHDTTALTTLWTNHAEGFKLLDEADVIVPPRDGTSTHPDRIKERLFKRMERNPIDALVMDTSDGEDIAAWASDELGITVVDRPQGNDLHVVDYKHFMRDLRATGPQKIVEIDPKTKRKRTRTALPLKIVRVCPLLTRHSMNAIGRRLPRGDVRFDRPDQSRGSARKQDVRVIDALTSAGMVNTHTNRWPEKSFDLSAFRITPG